MSDDLYRDHILDHYGNPRNWGRLAHADIVADADEPSCGDQVRIELALDGAGRVEQVAFEGEGCMISIASASILTQHAKGRSLEELESLTEDEEIAFNAGTHTELIRMSYSDYADLVEPEVLRG